MFLYSKSAYLLEARYIRKLHNPWVTICSNDLRFLFANKMLVSLAKRLKFSLSEDTKIIYQLPLTPQQSTINGVIKKVNTVGECFFVGLIETSTHYVIVLKE